MSQRHTRSQNRPSNVLKDTKSTLVVNSCCANADEQLQKFKKEIVRLKNALEIKEHELEDMETKFQSKIEELKRDNSDKDEHIERLRRRTQDFEDEVYESEQSFLTDSNRNKQTIMDLNKEIIRLGRENEEFNDKLKELESKNAILENNIVELTAIRRNMLTSIEVLTIDNDLYGNELKKMKKENYDLRNKVNHTHPVVKVNNLSSPEKRIASIPLVCSKEEKDEEENGSFDKEILFVSGNHGRGVAQMIKTQIGNSFKVHSVLKPNAGAYVLLQTALENSKKFSKNDLVILWLQNTYEYPNTRILSQMNHTNVLIITEPYRYDFDYINDLDYINKSIYENNLHLAKMNKLLC
ncbi:unnamed protein product [Phaedon cochleariae]|uniref:Uncharacterized protein n=1 Tax=Phaedon cochleariae TaxID=80249 RepID=A0A9N9SNU0_PHACE|nr:unnamed protein product [Phaedon cochleariae]